MRRRHPLEHVVGGRTLAELVVVPEADESLAARAGDGGQETGGLAVVALALVVLQQLERLAFSLPHSLAARGGQKRASVERSRDGQ